jgi:hypothetical protein
MGACLINSPRRTKIGHVEAFRSFTCDRFAKVRCLGLPAFVGSAMDQLEDFWRETLQSNAYDQSKYADLMKRLQGQVAHLPQADQDKFFMPFVTRNAEYIAIAKRDKDALKVPPSTLAG